MNAQLLSVAIVIASIMLYQTGMKIVPEGLSPFTALVTFYVTALVATLAAYPLLSTEQTTTASASFSWAAVLVGIAIVGIELGYLLMYRSGWHLAVAPLVTMAAASLLLLPVSLLFFQQPWSMRYLFGIAFCVYGLYLMLPKTQ